jgi:hypothetical protein
MLIFPPSTEEHLAPNLEIRVHLTGKDRPRLDIHGVLADVRASSPYASKFLPASKSAPEKSSTPSFDGTIVEPDVIKKTDADGRGTRGEGTNEKGREGDDGKELEGVKGEEGKREGREWTEEEGTQAKEDGEKMDSIWVYLSGPNKFIDAGEAACKDAKGVEWYGARWEI